jgi:PKD repeat protein
MRMKSIPMLCVIVLMLTLTTTGVSTASAPTRFYVDPPEIVNPALGIGDSFSVDLNVENVTELYGWNCNLTFRPDVLQVWVETLAFSTWMQTESGGAVYPLITVDNTAGFVFLGQIVSPFPPPPHGATGDGTLVTVTFNVTSVGASYLDLTSSKLNTKISGNNVPIPHTAEDGLFDNRIEILPPVAKISAPTSGVVGELLTFDASESNDTADNGWIVSYEWDFSLGHAFNVEATGEILTHSFGSKGTYTVGLRVTDNDGLTDTTTVSVTILTEGATYPKLVQKKAWSSYNHFVEAKHGTVNVLYARIKNPNDFEAFDVFVRFGAYDAKYGMMTGSNDSAVVELAPGQKMDVTAEFNINAPEFESISKAYIKAELWYYNTDTEQWETSSLVKWFSFAIVRV